MAKPQIDYGSDISCTDDLNPNLVMVDGTEALSQALYRRLDTPRGRLYRYPDYGYYLSEQISLEGDPERVKRGIEAELLKEERVENVQATVVLVDDIETEIETGKPIGTMIISINVEASVGPFQMVLAVDDVTVELLELA